MAKNPYKGFQATSASKIKTKGPILFQANDMDGRNSLANAQAMSAIFSNSAVLTVNEMGVSLHWFDCSFNSNE